MDHAAGHGTIAALGAGVAVAVPAAIFVLTVWAVQDMPNARGPADRVDAPLAAVLILMTPLTGRAVPPIGLILVVLVTTKFMDAALRTQRHVTPPPLEGHWHW